MNVQRSCLLLILVLSGLQCTSADPRAGTIVDVVGVAIDRVQVGVAHEGRSAGAVMYAYPWYRVMDERGGVADLVYPCRIVPEGRLVPPPQDAVHGYRGRCTWWAQDIGSLDPGVVSQAMSEGRIRGTSRAVAVNLEQWIDGAWKELSLYCIGGHRFVSAPSDTMRYRLTVGEKSVEYYDDEVVVGGVAWPSTPVDVNLLPSADYAHADVAAVLVDARSNVDGHIVLEWPLERGWPEVDFSVHVDGMIDAPVAICGPTEAPGAMGLVGTARYERAIGHGIKAGTYPGPAAIPSWARDELLARGLWGPLHEERRRTILLAHGQSRSDSTEFR